MVTKIKVLSLILTLPVLKGNSKPLLVPLLFRKMKETLQHLLQRSVRPSDVNGKTVRRNQDTYKLLSKLDMSELINEKTKMFQFHITIVT